MAPDPRSFLAVCTRRGWVFCDQVYPCAAAADAVAPVVDVLRCLLPQAGWPEHAVVECGFSSLDPDAPSGGTHDPLAAVPAGALCVVVIAASTDSAFATPVVLETRVAAVINAASFMADPAVARALGLLGQRPDRLPPPQTFDLGATSEHALLRVVPHAYRSCVAAGDAPKDPKADVHDVAVSLTSGQLDDLDELIQNPLSVENVEVCTVMTGASDADMNVVLLFVDDEPGPEPHNRVSTPDSLSVATLLYLASDGMTQTACTGIGCSSDPLGVGDHADLITGRKAWPETPRLFGYLPRPTGSCTLEIRNPPRSIIERPLDVPVRPNPPKFSARWAVAACDRHGTPASMRRARVLLQLRDWARLRLDPAFTARPFQSDRVQSRWSLVHPPDAPQRTVGAIVGHAVGAPESRIFGGDIALGHADDTTVLCLLCYMAATDGVSNATYNADAWDVEQHDLALGQLLLIDYDQGVLFHHRASPLAYLEAVVAKRGLVATPFTEFDNGALAARCGSADPGVVLAIAEHLAATIKA